MAPEAPAAVKQIADSDAEQIGEDVRDQWMHAEERRRYPVEGGSERGDEAPGEAIADQLAEEDRNTVRHWFSFPVHGCPFVVSEKCRGRGWGRAGLRSEEQKEECQPIMRWR